MPNFIPNTPESMVSFLFWHSMVMTCTTPLSRAFQKSWDGKLVHVTIMNYLGISQTILGRPAEDAYLKYPPSPKTNSAFLPHAICGLLWILAAYLHICHSRRLSKVVSKRKLASFASLAFLLHMACSVRALILDPMHHHALPWTMLLSNLTVSTAYFVLGIWAVTKREMSAHKDAMMKCFLYSIEGAGTIRTVGAILHLLEMGPTMCQQAHGGLASDCVFPYVQRLIGIRMLTLFYLGVYAKIPNFAETTFQAAEAWKAYKLQAAWNFVLNICIVSFFSVLNNPEALLTLVLSPYGNRGVGILITLVVGVITVTNPDSPALRAFVHTHWTSKYSTVQVVSFLAEPVSFLAEPVMGRSRSVTFPGALTRPSIVRRRFSDEIIKALSLPDFLAPSRKAVDAK